MNDESNVDLSNLLHLAIEHSVLTVGVSGRFNIHSGCPLEEAERVPGSRNLRLL